MTFLIPLAAAVTLLPGSACHAIDSESLLARDLAAYVPAFAQVQGDFLVGYLQSSGAQRVFKGADLERIARSRGLDVRGLNDLCFMRRTFIPQPAQIHEAIDKTLGIAGARIDVLSSSQQSVPAGEIIFPRNGVQAGTNPETTWHGFVQSADGRKSPVWARVHISAKMPRVIATAELQPRKAIREDQLKVELFDDNPLDDGAVRDLQEAVGFLSKVSIPKAAPLRKSQIERPMDVAYGDVVRVDVFAGAAHLSLEGRAESAGMTGSTITVRNLASGKDFRAQVLGKDHVTVGGSFE